ncbi:MAG: hypothetical protein JWM71_379, partial [Solirubrobacteraceae bacterium]|nr:hypothetical protein [Solirubrobacteraceae bacterium]
MFPYLSPDHDEPMYLVQAALLRNLHATLPASQYEYFRPWLSGVYGGRMLLVFQPVWPAVLAITRMTFGSFLPILALQAASVVLLMYLFAKELSGDRSVALTAAALAAASPFFWLRSGTFLAYLFSFGLELAVGTMVLRGWSSRSPRPWLAAGAVLGLLFFTRPLDAVIVSVLIAGCLPWAARPRLLRSLVALAVGTTPGVVGAAAYNAAITGSPFRFALHAAGGENSFGFGVRRIAAGAPPVSVHLHDAIAAMLHNLAEVPGEWMLGGWLLLPIILLGVHAARARRHVLVACGAVMIAFPLANLAYWGNVLIARNTDFLGPHYYLPLLAPLSILGAYGLVSIRRAWSPAGSAAVVVALAAATTPLALAHISANERMTAYQHVDRLALRRAHPHHALVLLPTDADGGWIGHPRPSLLNDPGLRQDVIFGIDRGDAEYDMFRHYPHRSVWRLVPRSVFTGTGVAPVTEV